MQNYKKIIIALSLIFIGVAGRLVDHPANFTPIIAIALFSTFYFKNRWSFMVPFLAMAISDYFIGFYNMRDMMTVYIAFLFAGYLGIICKKVYWVPIASILGSFTFFVVTNLEVWLFWYQPTWNGLIQCFSAAIPFYRNMFAGDLFYSLAIFGCYYSVKAYYTRKKLVVAKN